MNFCNLAVIAALVSTSTSTSSVSAFTTRNAGPRAPAFVKTTTSLPMIYPGSNHGSVVAFTTTIHREEVNLETLSIPQLKQMQMDLETINNKCTEEGTQTNPECDVELKDERDYAILKIQTLLNEKTGKNSKLKYVDMDRVRACMEKPWGFPLQTIRQHISDMEILNCECTEDGNQTDTVCDVQLKDERDAAIETLTMYVQSVETMLETEVAATATTTTTTTSTKKPADTREISRDARAKDQDVVVFVMGEIRDCIAHPGSKSLVEMQAMLAQLEAVHNACTEEGCQTNPECDVEVKAERDGLMESLVSMIHDARLCMDQIKAFAQQGDKLDEVAVDEVMEAVIKTIPKEGTAQPKQPASGFQPPSDEFLVQI